MIIMKAFMLTDIVEGRNILGIYQ